MKRRFRSQQATQAFIGILIIVVGLLLFLDNLDILETDDALRWWPVLLVAIGVFKLVQPRGSGGKLSGFILVVVGAVILLGNLDLVLIGGSMIWRAVSERRQRVRVEEGGEIDDVRIHGSVFLGSLTRSNASQDFRGGSLTAVMGACEIDLRSASMKGLEAIIDVFAWWGAIELRVPKDWAVVIEATPILGGIEDKTKHPADASKRLVIKGTAIMGAVEVRN